MTPGQRGEAVRDLQRRLATAGFPPGPGDEVGVFGAGTEAGVRAFQTARGLVADGRCDEHTWSALVEASWSLGDRVLVLTSPNMRGDDVAELQTMLARLGFDCGRVDGILGPRTVRALADFQTNCGLLADSVCGPDTVRALHRVSSQTGTGPGVGAVRELERLRSGPGALEDCRLVVGQFGGLSALTRTVARELRHHGATVMTLDEPDPVAQAVAANHFGADAYLGFESVADETAVAHFYRVPTFESVAGHSLADALVERLSDVPGLAPTTSGMRLPVLRETRMPAVLVRIGPVRLVLDSVPTLADRMVHALELWISRAT